MGKSEEEDEGRAHTRGSPEKESTKDDPPARLRDSFMLFHVTKLTKKNPTF